MKNFAYDQNPKTWADYYGQEQAINTAKKFLTEEPLQALLISGYSGLGKTAFALLLIRAAKCLNRAPDSIEPCGHCANCLAEDPRLGDPNLTDVWWVQRGANFEESINKSVTSAMIAAGKGQKHSGNKDDILFVVIDEFQDIPSTLRKSLIHNAELKNNDTNVCYIFITMQEELLDETELTAFKRRGRYLMLQPFTAAQIYDFIINRYVDCPADTASLIAKHSNQSIGMAIANYDAIKEFDSNLYIENAAKVLGCASNAQRSKLWSLLYNGNRFVEINSYVERISQIVSKKKLAQQLMDDVLNTVYITNMLTEEQNLAFKLLNQFICNHSSTQLTSYLMQLYKLPVASKDGIELSADAPLDILCD